MAKAVTDFPAGNSRAPLYDYDAWLDGNVWELVRGEDFDVSPEGMRSSLHNYAKRNEMRVKTKIRGESVFVQLLEEDEIEDDPED